MAFALAFLATATMAMVSQQIGVNERNSRIGAFAVRVVAGLVDEDFDVQLLSAESSEYKPVEEGMTDHDCRLPSIECG